jgi:hypothetical protein
VSQCSVAQRVGELALHAKPCSPEKTPGLGRQRKTSRSFLAEQRGGSRIVGQDVVCEAPCGSIFSNQVVTRQARPGLRICTAQAHGKGVGHERVGKLQIDVISSMRGSATRQPATVKADEALGDDVDHILLTCDAPREVHPLNGSNQQVNNEGPAQQEGCCTLITSNGLESGKDSADLGNLVIRELINGEDNEIVGGAVADQAGESRNCVVPTGQQDAPWRGPTLRHGYGAEYSVKKRSRVTQHLFRTIYDQKPAHADWGAGERISQSHSQFCLELCESTGSSGQVDRDDRCAIGFYVLCNEASHHALPNACSPCKDNDLVSPENFSDLPPDGFARKVKTVPQRCG